MEIIKFLQAFSNPLLDSFFQAASFLGEETFYILAVALIYWCISKRFGCKLGFIFLSNMSLNGAFKYIFNSPRPIGVEGIRSLRLETATDSSFPSGHTQGAAGFWTAIMLKIKKVWIYTTGTILIALVGISRLYLGVHWPKDIVFGIIFGAACAIAAGYVFDESERRDNKMILLLPIVPAVIGLIFIESSDYIKSTATLTGLFIGYCVEDNYIHFSERTSLLKQIIKYAVGIGILLLLKSVLKNLLPVSAASDFLRYVLIGFWVTAGAPYIFKKLICRREHRSIRTVQINI
jgi:membrane-associated phospholipid phosphatase